MKKICFVVSSPLTVHAFLSDQIRALSAHYEVHLAVNADPGTIAHADLRKATLHRTRIERSISPLADFAALLQLIGILRRGHYAAVHSLTPKAGLLSAIAAFVARVPVRLHTFTGQVWVTRQGPGRSILKALDRVIAYLDTHVLVDSASQLDFLRAEKVLGPAAGRVLGKGSVSGVDTGRFRPDPEARAAIRSELAIPAAAIVFLFVGRLTRDKGVRELAEAFRELAGTRGDAHLVMVGPDEDALAGDLTAACGPHAGRLHLIGMSAEPEKFMAGADVFCLPSHREGFGSVVIEAAAAGLPAIGSRIYGLTDAIEEGVTGLLVNPGEVDALAAAMRRMADDERLRTGFAAAARARALRDFSKEALTAAVVDLYRKLIPEGGPSHRTPS